MLYGFSNKCNQTYIKEGQYYVVSGPCVITKQMQTVRVPAIGLSNYQNGMLIQNAFPTLTAGEREFIKTGISDEGWEQMFGGDESEDE